MIIYYLTYFFTKLLSFIFFPRTVKGWEHVPLKGAYLLVSNHISNLDPPILGISTPRRLHFMAKIELFKPPLVGWWLRQLWAFPIKRGVGDYGALKVALNLLKDGFPVLLFPEGTRRLNDKPLPAQAGAGFIALKAAVPIVPVYIKGSNQVMAPGSKFFKRAPVNVVYGQAFDVKDCADPQAAADKMLKEIYKLS